jgi:hypothetical protein
MVVKQPDQIFREMFIEYIKDLGRMEERDEIISSIAKKLYDIGMSISKIADILSIPQYNVKYYLQDSLPLEKS